MLLSEGESKKSKVISKYKILEGLIQSPECLPVYNGGLCKEEYTSN